MWVGPKGPEWFGASQEMEDHMKLVTQFEAAARSTAGSFSRSCSDSFSST